MPNQRDRYPVGRAEATANKWQVAIAILDATGSLIMQKLDNTRTGSRDDRNRQGAHRARLSAAKQGHARRWRRSASAFGAQRWRWQVGCQPWSMRKVVVPWACHGVTSELDAQVAWPGPQQPSNRHGNAPVHGQASVPAPCCRTDRSAVGQAMRQLTRGIAKGAPLQRWPPPFCRLVR